MAEYRGIYGNGGAGAGSGTEAGRTSGGFSYWQGEKISAEKFAGVCGEC